ncbi:MAG: hypothetical protein AAB875_01325, partial [Patescibacteria group bacterium]
FKYLTKCDPQEMFTKNNEYWQPLLSKLRAELNGDPYINMEALDRKLLYSFFSSEGEELMNENVQQIPGMEQQKVPVRQPNINP